MAAIATWRMPVVIAAGVLFVDQVTKTWAVNVLDERTIELFWTLQLNLAFNSGMAFGRASGFGPYIAVLATIVIVVLLASLRSPASRVSSIGMGLLVGGAAGNLTDRMFRGDDGFLRGAVVDFIDLQWFPIFNVADMAINVGAGLLILASVVASRRARSEETE